MINGHKAGTGVAETRAGKGPQAGAPDVQSGAPSARLLDLRVAGAYLGVSYWTMRDLIFAGMIPTVKIPCPRARDGRVIRRVLIDVEDLKEFIVRHKETEQQ